MANAEDRRDRDPEPTAPPSSVGRRTFLKGAGALGAAAFAAPLVARDWSFVRAAVPGMPTTPIEHIVISCQENRSFDHYFGFAPWIGSYGVPAGYSQPDGMGGTVEPRHETALETPDIPHSWAAIHEQYAGGAMDGFFTNAGEWGAAPAGVVHHPELRRGLGRASAGRRLGRDGDPGGAHHGAA